MAAKKLKLNVSIEENYCLIGIVSDEPDYKLCWLINGNAGCNFVRQDDFSFFSKKLNDQQEVKYFYHDDVAKMMEYRLIVNQTSKGYFIPELEKIDYLLHIQGELDTTEIERMVRDISSIPAVRMCVPVDLKRIKERRPLELW